MEGPDLTPHGAQLLTPSIDPRTGRGVSGCGVCSGRAVSSRAALDCVVPGHLRAPSGTWASPRGTWGPKQVTILDKNSAHIEVDHREVSPLAEVHRPRCVSKHGAPVCYTARRQSKSRTNWVSATLPKAALHDSTTQVGAPTGASTAGPGPGQLISALGLLLSCSGHENGCPHCTHPSPGSGGKALQGHAGT